MLNHSLGLATRWLRLARAAKEDAPSMNSRVTENRTPPARNALASVLGPLAFFLGCYLADVIVFSILYRVSLRTADSPQAALYLERGYGAAEGDSFFLVLFLTLCHIATVLVKGRRLRLLGVMRRVYGSLFAGAAAIREVFGLGRLVSSDVVPVSTSYALILAVIALPSVVSTWLVFRWMWRTGR
jgi:hypothetical protein